MQIFLTVTWGNISAGISKVGEGIQLTKTFKTA